MDPNLSNEDSQATSHVVLPPPAGQSPVGGTEPQPSSGQPQQPPSLFAQMNSPKPGGLPHQVPPEEKPGRKINKKIALGILALLVLVGLPTTVYLTQQQQTTQNQAAESLTDSTVIAIFNGQKIYGKDIKAVAKEQNGAGPIDRIALKTALQIFLERKALDKEKADKGINVSKSEIAAKKAEDELSDQQAYYAVLRDKVMRSSTKNWQVYTISFWVPPPAEQVNLSVGERQQLSQVLSDGLLALNDAEKRLASEDAIDIAESLVTRYPSLSGYLGVNGHLLVGKDNTSLPFFQSPQTYTYEPSNQGQPFFDAIYSMTETGQIIKVVPEDGGVGAVIKLFGASQNSTFNSYDSWLKDRINSQSKTVFSL